MKNPDPPSELLPANEQQHIISEEQKLLIPTWIDPHEYPFTPKAFSLPAGTMRCVELSYSE